MNRALYILFIALFLGGCKMQTANTGMEEALSKAGNNREELFRVIRHYQESGDSLKLKAAQFGIGTVYSDFPNPIYNLQR